MLVEKGKGSLMFWVMDRAGKGFRLCGGSSE